MQMPPPKRHASRCYQNLRTNFLAYGSSSRHAESLRLELNKLILLFRNFQVFVFWLHNFHGRVIMPYCHHEPRDSCPISFRFKLYGNSAQVRNQRILKELDKLWSLAAAHLDQCSCKPLMSLKPEPTCGIHVL